MRNQEPSRVTAEPEVISSSIDGLDHVFNAAPNSDVADVSQLPPKKSVEMTILQAANALNVSERTVWRWIDSGQLKSRMKGNKRFVRVPTAQLQQAMSADKAEPESPNGAVGAVFNLSDVVAQLNGANYRVGYLESQIESYREQLKLLPDLQSKANELSVLGAKVEMLEKELAYHRLPWWKRLFSSV